MRLHSFQFNASSLQLKAFLSPLMPLLHTERFFIAL